MIGKLIKITRKRRGLSQAQLAEKIGVQRPVISKYETGLIEPSLSQLRKIAEALHVSMEVLQGYDIIDIDKQIEAIENNNISEIEEALGLPLNSIDSMDEPHKSKVLDRISESFSETYKFYDGVVRRPDVLDKYDELFLLDDFEALEHAFFKLNYAGRQKAIERIEELAEIPRYKIPFITLEELEELEGLTKTPSDKPLSEDSLVER